MSRRDPLTTLERSALMSKVRGEGNASTEMKVASVLRGLRISGWRRHPRSILGRPDFFFKEANLAVFVHGCFWHGCGRCGRIPKSNTRFWMAKIGENRRRDARNARRLRRSGIGVVTVWEHELSALGWVKRLAPRLMKTGSRVADRVPL